MIDDRALEPLRRQFDSPPALLRRPWALRAPSIRAARAPHGVHSRHSSPPPCNPRRFVAWAVRSRGSIVAFRVRYSALRWQVNGVGVTQIRGDPLVAHISAR